MHRPYQLHSSSSRLKHQWRLSARFSSPEYGLPIDEISNTNRESPIQHLGLLGSHPWAPATKCGIRNSIHWRCGLSFSWTTTVFDATRQHFEARISRKKKILYDTTSTLPANTLPITKTDRRKPVQRTSMSRNSVMPNNNLQNSVSWCIRQHNTIGMSQLAHSSYYTGFGGIHYLWRHQLLIFRNPIANKHLFPSHSRPNLRLS